MPIKDLVVNTNEVEESALETVVKKYFKYDIAGEVLFIDRAFWKLPGDKKVILLLAAFLGRKFLGLDGVEVAASNMIIGKKLNMKETSIRVYISQLRKSGSVVTENNKHMITTQGLHDLMEKQDE